MTTVKSHFFDAIDQMERDLGMGTGDAEVYLGRELFDALARDMHLKSPMAVRRVTEGPTIGMSDETGMLSPDYDEYPIHQIAGARVTTDPRIDPWTMKIIATGMFDSGKIMTVKDPRAVRVYRIEQEPRSTPIVCAGCSGSIDPGDVAVEGDEDEPFCSIDCLNEEYNNG